MTWTSNEQATIIRTERGLTIVGTRISLYDVIDFLRADYSPKNSSIATQIIQKIG